MVEDKNKYKREIYNKTLEKYKKAKTRIEKKKIKDELYSNPNLIESQKDEIWRKIMDLEYRVLVE